jgi:hypothetical protein
MSAQQLRQLQAIGSHQPKRIGQLKAIERSQGNPPPSHLVWIAPPRKRRWVRMVLAFQRLMDCSAEASWRLHDGVPAVWTLVGVIVLTASAAATVCIAAMAFGYQP